MGHWSFFSVFVLVVSLVTIITPFVLSIRCREPIFFWIGLGAFVWVGFTGLRLLHTLHVF